jgi:plastocyanin
MKARIWLSVLTISAGLTTAASAQITGKATYQGPPVKPKKINMSAVPDCAKQHTDPVFDEQIVLGEQNELKNVAVYIKDGAKLGGAAPTTPVVLDQKGCMYVPHVVTVMVGQTLQAKNSDGFLHNVHGLAKDNGEFNFPQQTAGQTDQINATKAVETYKVKCDVHPWMAAWVVVVDSPYSAVTGDDGTFKIDTKGLPAGKYTLVARQEKFGVQEAEIDVKDGKATANFKFTPKKASADAVKEVQEVLAKVSKPADAVCEHCDKDAAAAVVASKDAAKGTQPQAAAK